jgi:hypothetical protein
MTRGEEFGMDRWRELINDLIQDFQVEDRREISRTNIDDKIWEREEIAAHAELARRDEKPEERRQEFLAELTDVLRQRLIQERSNRAWQEALKLLENPGLRVPDHQRPK